MAFISCNNGNLTNIFVTESEIIDQFVGNQLWMWGEGSLGRLGDNTTVDKSSPVQTVSRGFDWEQISIGNCHSGGLKTDGTLWLWGESGNGQLGNNSVLDRSSPVQAVTTGTNWKQLSVGDSHSAAIKTDGTLWLWGLITSGLLGIYSTINQSSPVQTISTGTNWKQVSAGYLNTAAIKTDGTLWMWGCGACGMLGNNNTTNHSSPIQTISTGTNWKQVTAGIAVSGAIKTDGTLWLWGCNDSGQLGNNSTINESSPIQTISTGTNWKQVSGGGGHSAAIKIDGTLWVWGCAAVGRLGNNSTISQSSPIQTIATGTNWKQVSLGCRHSAAIKIDGTLWLWGSGACGSLGNNSSTNQSSPIQTIVSGTNWKQVSAGMSVNTPSTTGAVTHTEN